jgi:hypothetical protein
MGCFKNTPGFLFARGQNRRPFLDTQLAALEEAPGKPTFRLPAATRCAATPPDNAPLPSSVFRSHPPLRCTPTHALNKTEPQAARGQKDPLEAALSPTHFVVAAWAALVFEKLALGLGPEAGGGSIGSLGEAKLWEAP